MKQEGLKFFTDTYLTAIGLMIFFGYFVFIAIQAFRMKFKKLEYLKNIPFEGEES